MSLLSNMFGVKVLLCEAKLFIMLNVDGMLFLTINMIITRFEN